MRNVGNLLHFSELMSKMEILKSSPYPVGLLGGRNKEDVCGRDGNSALKVVSAQ